MSYVRETPRFARRLLRAAGVIAVAALLVQAVHAGTGPGGDSIDHWYNTWGITAFAAGAAIAVAYRAVAAPAERGAWAVLAAGLTSYAVAAGLWSFEVQFWNPPPYPSICDAGWLLLYPAAYVSLVLLVRARMGRFHRSLWLDGLIAALGAGALTAWVVYDPVMTASRSATAGVVLTNLAYPVADLLLLALVLGVFALSGWRPNLPWLLLGGGFMAFAGADTIYLRQVADGSYIAGGVANVMWSAALVLMALAAWQRPREIEIRLDGLRMLAVPGVFTLVSLALLIVDHFAPTNDVATLFAAGALAASMARTVMTFNEIRALAESRRLAMTDDLTGLANRRAFNARLEEVVAQARREDAPAAVLLIDLDRFKELNDTLGHPAGDELLARLGPRLREAVRGEDTLARLGGDEFGVLLPETTADVASAVAARVLAAIERPFTLDGLRVHVGSSIGIATFPDHAETSDRLMQCADIAMYRAKNARTGIEVYAGRWDEHRRDRLVLAMELRAALARDEIVVHFQPTADTCTREITGAEALVRWNHPRLGLMSPDRFLDVAEQAGLTRRLTTVVLETALQHLRAWHVAGHDLTLAVNLSIADVLDTSLPGDVARMLRRWDVPPARLRLEITENTVMADVEGVVDILERLVLLGVEVSLDDFGTGHASLAHLKRLPVAQLKVDRSFVSGMCANRVDAAIVRSTVELARQLGIGVVAEGVEDDETWSALEALGCDLVQGYALSRPLPAERLLELLERAPRAPASPA